MFGQSASTEQLNDIHSDMICPGKNAIADAGPDSVVGKGKGKGKGKTKGKGQTTGTPASTEDGSHPQTTPDKNGAHVAVETPVKAEKVLNWCAQGVVDEKKVKQWMQNLEGDISDGRLMVPKLKVLEGPRELLRSDS